MDRDDLDRVAGFRAGCGWSATTRDRPPARQHRLDQHAPSARRAIRPPGQQAFQVVEHEQDGDCSPAPRSDAAASRANLGAIDHMQHGQPGICRSTAPAPNRAAPDCDVLVLLSGARYQTKCLEPADRGVMVGQLHGAARLAAARHAVEQHAAPAAVGGQRRAGVGHRRDPTDEMLRHLRKFGERGIRMRIPSASAGPASGPPLAAEQRRRRNRQRTEAAISGFAADPVQGELRARGRFCLCRNSRS